MVIGDVELASGAFDGRNRMRLHERLLILGLQRGQVRLLVLHFDHAHCQLGGMQIVDQ
jgi:hypothetical protein